MGNSLLINGSEAISVLDQLPILLAETSRLASLANSFWVGLQVAVGLGFVIFVHELGHFLAAKTFGVRCDKFYVGFDVPISLGPIKLPRTLGKFQWGETEYGIGIIPLGGYVKMLGQDDDPRNAEEEAAKIREGEDQDAPLDPRSYPAKPVWQRMIIISAGVVMNMIFAVILAGIAYQNGVPYRPTVAGAVYGGGPAWMADIQPGDQIIRVADMKQDFEHLRYDDFGMKIVMQGFETQDADIPFASIRDSQRIEKALKPTAEYSREKDIYRVGLLSQLTSEVAPVPMAEYGYLAQQGVDLRPGDVIDAVDGSPLKPDPRFDEVLGTSLTSRFKAKWEQPLSLTVSRKSEDAQDATRDTVEIEVPPVPVHTLGMGFAPGPVSAIRDGSLAAEAGFQLGDVIQQVNDQPVEDALQLPSMVARLAGQPVTVQVARANSDGVKENVELTFTNVAQAHFDAIAVNAGQLTLGGIGVAFDVLPVVQSVDDSVESVQPGDEVLQVQWILDDEQQKKLAKDFNEAMFEPLVIGDAINVASLFDVMQSMPDGVSYECVVRRDGKVLDPITLTTSRAEDWYWHERGIRLTPLMQVHRATSVTDAAGLGLWETSRRFTEVLNFLKLLVTGRIGAKGLGGPGRIAYAAASEANLGVSRLLLFLTLLSANLAILNFLPIPALDGGHMVFLTAEAIRGKPVSEALQVRLTMAGVLGLLSLMAFVIVKDIMWFI